MITAREDILNSLQKQSYNAIYQEIIKILVLRSKLNYS